MLSKRERIIGIAAVLILTALGRGRGGNDRGSSDSSTTRAGIRVTAVADERTNSVVVRGPSESLEVVAEVVKALDSRSAAAVDVKVFHLEYADADNTAELINEVFGADRSSSRSSSRDDMPMSFRRSPGGGGQTIVIGGLVEDQLIESVKKIPGLGDLPVIGHLFKRTTTEKAKKELLIFLTPLVAMADDELTAISEAEKNRNTLTQQGMGAELFDQHMEGMRGYVDPNER